MPFRPNRLVALDPKAGQVTESVATRLKVP
jgi:hypothetical protein